MNIRDSIHTSIANQFPEFYREEGDFLISFIEAYYQHNDAVMDRDVPKLRDIDTTLTKFLVYYKKKYLADLPLDATIDVRYIIKHIRDMYNRKGTEESLELLFRLFFDEEIEVSYPSNSILKPSDSIWGGDTYLEMLPVYTVDDYPIQKGNRIRGDISLSSAFVDEVIFVNFGGALSPIIYISNIAGAFTSDDSIVIVEQDTDGLEQLRNVGKLISGSMSSIDVKTANRKANQSVGDKVKIKSALTGVEGEGRVTATSDMSTGSIEFDIVDGGFGYVDPSSVTAENVIGISNVVLIADGTEVLDIKVGDELYAIGSRINYSNTEAGLRDYTLTGSAKVIAYNHPLIFCKTTTSDEMLRLANEFTGSQASNSLSSAFEYYAVQTTSNIDDLPGYEGVATQVLRTDSSGTKYDSDVRPPKEVHNTTTIFRNLTTIQEYMKTVVGKAITYNQTTALANAGFESGLQGAFGSLIEENNIFADIYLPGIDPFYLGSPISSYTGNNNWFECFGRLFAYMSYFDVYPQFTVNTEYTQGYYNESGVLDPSLGTDVVQAGSITIPPSNFQGSSSLNAQLDKPASTDPTIQNRLNATRTDGAPAVLPDTLTDVQINLKVWRKGRYISTAPEITINRIGSINADASFEVATITNEETVSLITDQIGDFGSIVLDGPGADDYEMSGPGQEDLNTRLQDAFTSITVKIGTIDTINTLNTGENYQNDVAVEVIHRNIAKFDKRDIIVTFDNVSFNLEAGTIVTQNRVIPDIEINQSGNITESEIETMGASTTGGGYLNSNTQFQFNPGSTIDYVAKAKFLKRVGNNFYFRPLSFYGLETGIGIDIAGDSRIPITILQDPDSQPMGANAEIVGRASYETGQIQEVAVTKTGYKYIDHETVEIINNEKSSPDYNTRVANAQIRALGQGKTEGRWDSNTSFLSDSSKKLHDNNYYQEYSYEISSIVDPKIYAPLIGDTVGVAGTKLFSTPLINSVNALESDLEVEFGFFDVETRQYVTTPDGDNIVGTGTAINGTFGLLSDEVVETEGPQGL